MMNIEIYEPGIGCEMKKQNKMLEMRYASAFIEMERARKMEAMAAPEEAEEQEEDADPVIDALMVMLDAVMDLIDAVLEDVEQEQKPQPLFTIEVDMEDDLDLLDDLDMEDDFDPEVDCDEVCIGCPFVKEHKEAGSIHFGKGGIR